MKQLTKQAAAALLGCTERQIQRYTQSGKLTVEYVQEGKTRKAMFSESEVVALKQQLDAPEVRGIAVRTAPVSEPTPQPSQPAPLVATNPVMLPMQAQQALQMLGATSFAEAGKCVMVEEMKFDKLVVGKDGSTRMSGVSVSRYSARA